MKYHLVTTADERTWKSERPVLFLGEWCRRYDRRHVWAGMNADVAKPFGITTLEIRTNTDYAQTLNNELLEKLTGALNQVHGTQHGSRYWNIVVGHWLATYVDVVFNRYFTLQKAVEDFKVSSSTVLSYTDTYQFATSDLVGFFAATSDSEWNHALYARILRAIGSDVRMETQEARALSALEKYSLTKRGAGAKQWIRKIAEHFLSTFSGDSDALLINTYLSRLDEFKLALSLGQSPQLWRTPSISRAPYNPDMRGALTVELKCNSPSRFERFLCDNLVEMLPVCYLEGYKALIQQKKSLHWPSAPSFIFTSNSFHSDEIFKAWAAEKTEQGIPYFVGQHGNNYGTAIESKRFPELATCDAFFTWGWSYDKAVQIPAFNFKIASSRKRHSNAKVGILLIEKNPPLGFELNDASFTYVKELDEKFHFVENLPKSLQELLTVRLYPAWRRYLPSEDRRWKDRFPFLTLDTGETKIYDQINRHRLIIHAYDSTGVLETLALNIPTLCFWPSGTDHILDEVRDRYKLLEDAGILFTSATRTAKFVESSWQNLENWWNSPKVQTARQRFCQEFSRIDETPTRTLAKLLRSQSNIARERHQLMRINRSKGN